MNRISRTNVKCLMALTALVGSVFVSVGTKAEDAAPAIVHDAEQYVLEAQNGQLWAAQDKDLDARLAALRKKYGRPPNIIHVMWDDTAVGEVGIPAIQKVRGFETPVMNGLAAEGINFMRMYTEPSCTPSRAAVITGRKAVRSGMYAVSFPVESDGMDAGEVTTAQVLSRAGYATAFYGKWHLGDTKPSYPTEMGFDDALWTPYNQVPSMWTPPGEMMGTVTGMYKQFYPKDPYDMDDSWQPKGSVWTLEAKKGGPVKEWGPPPDIRNYWKIDGESASRTLAFAEKSNGEKKPFYIAWWPVGTAFFPNPDAKGHESTNKTVIADALTRIDSNVGVLMNGLKKAGLTENTLVVLMADNGPFSHGGPRGMTETLYRGGKGDWTEGGVRVPAIAYWPGVIKPGQTIGDIISETDLFTTFARLGNAIENIPTDRIIDGIDQTSLFLNGDGFSHRDYEFIYQGTTLSAAIKGRFKRQWAGAASGLSGAEFFDLYADPREEDPQMIPLFSTKSMFNRQRQRHEFWMKKYPNREGPTVGPALTGIENVRPETMALSAPPVNLKKLPFDIMDVRKQPLPWTDSDSGD
jgi:arylsulfatase A-like enzyme